MNVLDGVILDISIHKKGFPKDKKNVIINMLTN